MKTFAVLLMALCFAYPAMAEEEGPFKVESIKFTKNRTTILLSDGRSWELNCSTSTSAGLCNGARDAFNTQADVYITLDGEDLEAVRLTPPAEPETSSKQGLE